MRCSEANKVALVACSRNKEKQRGEVCGSVPLTLFGNTEVFQYSFLFESYSNEATIVQKL